MILKCEFSSRNAFTTWSAADGPDNRPQPSGRACPVDRAECVDVGPGLVAGWVRDPSEVELPSVKSIEGCWAIDLAAMRKTNDVSIATSPRLTVCQETVNAAPAVGSVGSVVIDSTCRSGSGGKSVCSEQIAFLLEGHCPATIRNMMADLEELGFFF